MRQKIYFDTNQIYYIRRIADEAEGYDDILRRKAGLAALGIRVMIPADKRGWVGPSVEVFSVWR